MQTRTREEVAVHWDADTVFQLPRTDAKVRNLRVTLRVPDVPLTREQLTGMTVQFQVGGSVIMTVDVKHAGSIWGDSVTVPCFTPDTDVSLYLLAYHQVMAVVKMPPRPTDVPTEVVCGTLTYEGDGRGDIGRLLIEARRPDFTPVSTPEWPSCVEVPLTYSHNTKTFMRCKNFTLSVKDSTFAENVTA